MEISVLYMFVIIRLPTCCWDLPPQGPTCRRQPRPSQVRYGERPSASGKTPAQRPVGDYELWVELFIDKVYTIVYISSSFESLNGTQEIYIILF